MELEIHEAFIPAGVKDDKAKAAVESINKEIDKRYKLHADQLAARGDVAEVGKEMAEMGGRLLKAINEMQRWTMASIFAGMTAVAAITKLM